MISDRARIFTPFCSSDLALSAFRSFSQHTIMSHPVGSWPWRKKLLARKALLDCEKSAQMWKTLTKLTRETIP